MGAEDLWTSSCGTFTATAFPTIKYLNLGDTMKYLKIGELYGSQVVLVRTEMQAHLVEELERFHAGRCASLGSPLGNLFFFVE